jgi:hypothetical protein
VFWIALAGRTVGRIWSDLIKLKKDKENIVDNSDEP